MLIRSVVRNLDIIGLYTVRNETVQLGIQPSPCTTATLYTATENSRNLNHFFLAIIQCFSRIFVCVTLFQNEIFRRTPSLFFSWQYRQSNKKIKVCLRLHVLLAVHPVKIFVNRQLDAQFFFMYVHSILYMFRTAMCPSSGE